MSSDETGIEPEGSGRQEGAAPPAGQDVSPDETPPPLPVREAPAPPPSGLIASYFHRTRRYGRLRFILEMALLAIPLKIVLGVLWAVVGGESGPSTTEAIDTHGPEILVLNACVLAPLLETLIGQWLPLWIASLFTRKTAWRVGFSTAVFSAMHLHVGVTGILTALPPGIFLAWSFALKRERSRWEAYWVTTLIHAVHNAVTLVFYFAFK